MNRCSTVPINRRPCLYLIALLAILFVGAMSGCTRAKRDDAVKVANAGTTTAKQMEEYYQSLSQDTIRTWELNAFSEGHGTGLVAAKFDQDIAKIDVKISGVEEAIRRLPADANNRRKMLEEEKKKLKKDKDGLLETKSLATRPAPIAETRKSSWSADIATSKKQIEEQKEKPKTEESDAVIRILEASIKQKEALLNAGSDQEAAYVLYQQRYDALLVRKQMSLNLRSVYEQFGRLAAYNAPEDVQAKASELSASLGNVLDTPMPDVSAETDSLIGGFIGDAIRELMVVQQNKSILKTSRSVVPTLQRLSAFFDNEKTVYKSIPVLRASFTTQTAFSLIDNNMVSSTALFNDVLVPSDLKWVDPQAPFLSDPMKNGVKTMISARNRPLQKASADAADNLSKSLAGLIKLHHQLETPQAPPSLYEFAQSSTTVQIALNQLAQQEDSVSVDDVMNLMKALSKEKKND